MAIFPASATSDTITSHGGLTYFVSEILSYVGLERYRKADLGWWAFPPRA